MQKLRSKLDKLVIKFHKETLQHLLSVIPLLSSSLENNQMLE